MGRAVRQVALAYRKSEIVGVVGSRPRPPVFPPLSIMLSHTWIIILCSPAHFPEPVSSVSWTRMFLPTRTIGSFLFGKQSLWWSPDYSDAFLMSDSAAPIYMFRVTREAPFEIPLLSRLLGPMKIDLFFGKLSGNQFPARPLIHGEKFTFKPVPNLEFGFSRTAEMAGAYDPYNTVNRATTLKAIERSYFSLTNSDEFLPGQPNPGKRMGGFDFNYRIPYLRNWLTLYSDSFSTDNVSPFADLERAAFAPGIYLTHFPKLSKLDLRVEASYSDTPKVHYFPNCVSNCAPPAAYGQFNYYDSCTTICTPITATSSEVGWAEKATATKLGRPIMPVPAIGSSSAIVTPTWPATSFRAAAISMMRPLA